MTSLFSSSWMCRQCGREACAECYEIIRELTSEYSPNDRQEKMARRERHAHTNPFFLSCTKRTEHGVHSFNAVSRFIQSELDDAVRDMEKLTVVEKETASTETKVGRVNEQGGSGGSGGKDVNAKSRGKEGSSVDPQMDVDGTSKTDEASGAAANGHTIEELLEKSSGSATEPDNAQASSQSPDRPVGSTTGFTSEGYDDGVCTLVSNPVPPSPSSSTPPSIPSWPVPYYTFDSLTEPLFSALWARGTPLLVTGLLNRFEIQWTPQYFIEKYGQQACIILECQVDTNKRVTVGEFFDSFGKYDERKECWKLKVRNLS